MPGGAVTGVQTCALPILLTWVASVSELLPGTASAVPEDTVAVRSEERRVGKECVSRSVMDGAEETRSEGRVRVTVVVAVQVQPVPVAEKSVVPEGSGSETETELATEGP